MVANKFLEEVEMSGYVRTECVWMCKYFHESVRKTSERYDHVALIMGQFNSQRRKLQSWNNRRFAG